MKNNEIEKLQKENEIMKRYLTAIYDLGFDRDGCTKAESLGKLVDELTRYASLGIECDTNEPMTVNDRGTKYNILGEILEEKADYIQKYEEFWKYIIENEDKTLNKDQIMRELFDYSMVMNNCERAYDLMTGGIISKASTKFKVVEEIFCDKYIMKDDHTIYGYDSDLLDILDDAETLEELKQNILDYFEIDRENLEETGGVGL